MTRPAVVRPEAARGAARAVGGHAVVAPRVGAEGVRRAHGDGRRLVAGRVNLPVDFVSGGVLAVVAGRGDDDDAGVNELAHGVAHGVVSVVIYGRLAEAQVDDAYLVERAVSQHPVNRV